MAQIDSTGIILQSQGLRAEIKASSEGLQVGDHIQLQTQMEHIELQKELWVVKKVSFIEKFQRPGSDNNIKFPLSTVGHLNEWMCYLKKTRELLIHNGLQEVETPFLVPHPGSEPTLEPIQIELTQGSKKENCYLPTSPELSLKKRLCQGWTDIFEIKTCFRDNEDTPWHKPEFHMLEWYRVYSGLEEIKKDLQELITGLAHYFDWPEKLTLREQSVAELFKKVLGVSLTPQTTREELEKWILKEKIELSQPTTFSWNDLFFVLMIERIEPYLKSQSQPTMVTHYPPSLAALAKITPSGWADRFELYWQGVELANAFNELTDPELQRARFHQDNEEKKQLGLAPIDLDEEFLQALERGLPPTGGIALGLDRLFVLFKGLENLSQLRL